MMWGYGWDMSWSWLFALFGLLVLVGIVLIVVLLVRLFGGAGSHGGGSGVTGPAPGRSRARQILDERYATGEITAEQYREQIQVLGENG